MDLLPGGIVSATLWVLGVAYACSTLAVCFFALLRMNEPRDDG